MTRTADPNKKTNTGVYKSQIDANKAFEDTMDKIILRVPSGARDAIKRHVMTRAAEDPESTRYSNWNRRTDVYTPSVNAFICSLIEDEFKRVLNDDTITLGDLKDAVKDGKL